MTHFLKTWPAEFEAVARGDKTHEVRSCADRRFVVGDDVVLCEFVPAVGPAGVERDAQGHTLGRFTNRALLRRVTHVTPGGGWGLPEGLCVLSINGRDTYNNRAPLAGPFRLDAAAAAGAAAEEITGNVLDVSFCDTGNESPIVHDYIAYLEERLRIGITRVFPGLDFYELAARKKRFPSSKARFCTYFLKVKPTLDYINATFKAGRTMTLHSGVRAAESADRAKLFEREYDGQFLCEIVRPLLRLSISDVWRMHERYGVRPNPLYAAGMSRVGCFPCVMSRKSEIARIAKLFPERIDMLRERELLSGSESHGNYSSFFPAKAIPSRFHSRDLINRHGKRFSVASIDDVVAWANTERGAKIDPRLQYDLGLEYDKLPTTEERGPKCQSGFCE